jgi:hypothetical protein
MGGQMNGVAKIVVVALVVFAYWWASTVDFAEEQRAESQYCEMVALWDQSRGDLGWPPYKGREPCR